MNRKLVSLVLSGLIISNSLAPLETIYAHSNNGSKELTKNEDTKSKNVVYLENGEGHKGVGNGTEKYPYQNIRTALEKIEDGGVLKIKGIVSYNHYEQDDSGAALPLLIDKNITIEGEIESELSVRAPIQLGADVTFRNIKLEMVPAVLLGRMLGQPIERSATIFVSGHKLTLDNVNTRVGTNLDQYDDRPYISGGSYKTMTTPTGKSVINIINPNSETKLSGIYAGDYYKDLNLDVEINIDGNVVLDKKIYTGGHNHKLNGNVTVNLGTNSNITQFDKSNQNGKIDVNLNKDAYITNFDAKNINNLTLAENTGVILGKDATFDVNNLVLKNNARIDFRGMANNTPTIKGDFEGETTIDTSRKGGTIFLNNEQTLDITGKLSGTTRLNNKDWEPVNIFLDNHIYVKTHENSSGILTIDDSMFNNYKLTPVKDNNRINWTTNRLEQGFGGFKWLDEDSRITPSNSGFGQISFGIGFIDDEGKEYIPYDDLFTDFEYTVTKLNEDGKEDEVINLNTEDNSGVDKDKNLDFYLTEDDEGQPRIVILLKDTNKLKNNKMILKITHKKTQKSISKNIYVVKSENKLTGSVTIEGSPIEGNTISANISKLPNDIEDVKYKWYVKDSSGYHKLVQDQTGKDFVLIDEYVGKTIKVEVQAMNYLNSVYSNEVIVKSKGVAPVIKGIENTEIKVSEVDKFNSGENLTGITGEDHNGNLLTVNVTGEVEKPEAGTNKTFKIIYSVTDNDGNTTEKIREVTVTNQKPTISGLTDIFITQGETYNVKEGVSAQDYEDKTIPNIKYPKDDLTKLGVGVHKIKYSAIDSDNNIVEEERRVVVYKKTSLIGPKIEGIEPIELKISQVDEFNKNHKLTGVTVSDDIDEPSKIELSVSGEVGKPSDGKDKTYELIYTAVDSDLNKTIQKRIVTVKASNNINITDVKGHWAENNILNFLNQGHINGYEDKTFRPDNSITRAEFIKIVNKVFGYNDKGTQPFTDVNQNDWYYNDVCIAVKAGYINGKTPTIFEPNSAITRQEVAKILTTIKNNKDTNYDKLPTFKDGHNVDDWAKPYVEGALDAGYFTGDDKGYINPTNNITRAEAVTVLTRVEK